MISITEWLKQLIAALVLAGFIEMILPANGLKGVAKMMMGLFIIILLIQPLGHLLHMPVDIAGALAELNFQQPPVSTDEVIRRGLDMRNAWTNRQNQNNQAVWEEKVSQTVGMIDDVSLTKLTMKFDGSIPKRALIRIKPLPHAEMTERRQDRTIQQIVNGIGLVTGLKAKEIEVVWDD
jgi:stage III sporulation protein AF